MTVISETTWRRLPWHAKARIVANLEAEARTAKAVRDRLLEQVDQLRQEIDTRLIYLHGLPVEPLKIIHPTDEEWSDDELRAAHAAYSRGVRDPWTVAGHRIWDKQRAKRRYERHKVANRERMRVRRAREREQRAA